MGLRVASLVNLSFLGGDRADEAAARFVGHNGRTRAIPDGIRRFMTWAPLLIPFYIPRGTEWDFAWTGAEKLARGGPMPEPVRTLGLAYAGVIALSAAAAGAVVVRERRKTGRPAPGSKARRPSSPAIRDPTCSTTARSASRSFATAGARPSSWARSAAAAASTSFAARSIRCRRTDTSSM